MSSEYFEHEHKNVSINCQKKRTQDKRNITIYFILFFIPSILVLLMVIFQIFDINILDNMWIWLTFIIVIALLFVFFILGYYITKKDYKKDCEEQISWND